jgi:hypothetical protein
MILLAAQTGAAEVVQSPKPKSKPAVTDAATSTPTTAPNSKSASASTAAPATAPARAPAPAKRLNLGPYVDPYGPVTAERILDVPHFETRVEVQGKAMDSAALTARMEWWMRDFEPMRGAVSRAGSAPSVEEMREHRPHPPDSLNILPIIDWLVDKLNKRP